MTLELGVRAGVELASVNLSPSSPRALAEVARGLIETIPDKSCSQGDRDILCLLDGINLPNDVGLTSPYKPDSLRCEYTEIHLPRRRLAFGRLGK